MKRLMLLVLVAAVVPAMMLGQGNEASNDFTVPAGRWRALLNWDPYNMAWTHVPTTGATDFSGLAVLSAGAGVEWAYRDNRTVRADVHMAFLGRFPIELAKSDSKDDNLLPKRQVNGVSARVMPMWYVGRWALGAGPSFEYRHVDYSFEPLPEDVSTIKMDDFSGRQRRMMDRYGLDGIDVWHYNLGLTFTAGYRFIPTGYVGVEYSPRVVVSTDYRYQHETTLKPPVLGKNSNGKLDHQLSLVWRMAIDLNRGH